MFNEPEWNEMKQVEKMKSLNTKHNQQKTLQNLQIYSCGKDWIPTIPLF